MYYGKNEANTLGAAVFYADQVVPQSELAGITDRIHSFANAAEGIASQLCDHADRVHGATPPPTTGNGTVPCRMGQLGSLHDALDRLGNIQVYLAEQAGRNCNLA